MINDLARSTVITDQALIAGWSDDLNLMTPLLAWDPQSWCSRLTHELMQTYEHKPHIESVLKRRVTWWRMLLFKRSATAIYMNNRKKNSVSYFTGNNKACKTCLRVHICAQMRFEYLCARVCTCRLSHVKGSSIKQPCLLLTVSCMML